VRPGNPGIRALELGDPLGGCLTHTFIIFQPPYWGKREDDTMLSERQKQSYHRIFRKTCPVCGAEFDTFNAKVRYDSHICSRRAKKGKRL
jgi:hypothetical protein